MHDGDVRGPRGERQKLIPRTSHHAVPPGNGGEGSRPGAHKGEGGVGGVRQTERDLAGGCEGLVRAVPRREDERADLGGGGVGEGRPRCRGAVCGFEENASALGGNQAPHDGGVRHGGARRVPGGEGEAEGARDRAAPAGDAHQALDRAQSPLDELPRAVDGIEIDGELGGKHRHRRVGKGGVEHVEAKGQRRRLRNAVRRPILFTLGILLPDDLHSRQSRPKRSDHDALGRKIGSRQHRSGVVGDLPRGSERIVAARVALRLHRSDLMAAAGCCVRRGR